MSLFRRPGQHEIFVQQSDELFSAVPDRGPLDGTDLPEQRLRVERVRRPKINLSCVECDVGPEDCRGRFQGEKPPGPCRSTPQ